METNLAALKIPNDVTGQSPDVLKDDARLGLQRSLRARQRTQIALRETLKLAEAQFGLSYPQAEISERVRESIPRRLFDRRFAIWRNIADYEFLIPDAALAKYQEAQKSGYFAGFHVVRAEYRKDQPLDPWLVGQILDRFIVLAYWD